MSMKLIRQAAITRLSSLFPTHKEFINVFNIEDNPDTILLKGYGARWGEGLNAESPTRRVGFNSTLLIFLTYGINVREDDLNASQIDFFYDDIDTIIKDFFDQTMIGIPNVIRGLKRPTIQSPQLISGGEYVLFTIEIVVDYTIPINT